MGLEIAAALGGGALLGGLSGAIPKKTSQESVSSVDLNPQSAAEAYGGQLVDKNARSLENMVAQGPGASDVSNATGASRDLAALLKQYSEGGNMPTATDVGNANSVAGNLFGAQREQMRQAFADQQTQANNQAALMGRSVNDPILRAKLAQEQTRQQGVLDASQGAWAQQFALAQPEQRLGFANQRSGILSGLASQAMANRQALASMGSQLQEQERSWRYNTSTKTNSANMTSGGGLGGALSGAIGGLGAGMSFAGGLQSLGLTSPFSGAGGGQMGGWGYGGGTQFGGNSSRMLA